MRRAKLVGQQPEVLAIHDRLLEHGVGIRELLLGDTQIAKDLVGEALRELHIEPFHEGDLITQVNVRRLLERHDTRSNLATIGLHSHSLEMPYGVVKTVDADAVELVEKPTESYLVNAGIYVLSRALVARVPDGKLFPITKLFDDALSRNETIGWYLIEEDWIDVGSHRDLDEARGRT